MKKIFLITVLGLMSSMVFAQSSTEKEIFEKGLKYNDLEVAKFSLYQRIVKEPNNVALLDTLALLYFNSRQYVQTILVANDVLEVHPKNKSVLEMRAVAHHSLGLVKEALVDYEALYKLEQNVQYQYQIAEIQYQLKRLGECELNLNSILNNPESAKQKVNISVGQKQQEVVLLAAAYNILGVMQMSIGKEDVAEVAFTKAVEIQEDFILAENNLKYLASKKQQENPEEEAEPVKEESKKKKKK